MRPMALLLLTGLLWAMVLMNWIAPTKPAGNHLVAPERMHRVG